MVGTWVVLALMLAQAGGDTVILRSGARVEGEILEASQSAGVTLRLPDGGIRWFHPMAVDRIERAGGLPESLESPPAGEEPQAPAAMEPVASPEGPPAAATAPSSRGPIWLTFAYAKASPLGSSGSASPSLRGLVGPDQDQFTFEVGYRYNERDSWGAVLDVSVGAVGQDLEAVCARYGTECSTATAQLGLFLRRDFAPLAPLNPWASVGVAREWLAGEVFAPYGGGESISVLSAPGWQFARFGAGIDWRIAPRFGLGLYTTLALGAYDRVTIDGVDVDGGSAVHGWAQVGLRAIFGP